MLTTNEETFAAECGTGSASGGGFHRENSNTGKASAILAKMLSVEWLGQTIASVCWIVSMLVYGISSTGDWLQLMAACAWLVANVASLVNTEAT